jgi:chromosome segregation ATPase
MTDVLVPVVLLIGIATLAVAIVALRSSRRSEDFGEKRYDLLRDQQDRLTLLHEERQMLLEELKRESQERQQLLESLKEGGPHLIEELKQARQWGIQSAHRDEQEQERSRLQQQELQRLEEELEQERRVRLEVQRRVEQLEQEGDERSMVQQQAERAAHNLQQLRRDLEREREERLEAQRRAEQLEEERLRLERELGRSKEEPGGWQSEARPWWRRPVLVVGLLFGALAAWFTSLAVALNLLSP